MMKSSKISDSPIEKDADYGPLGPIDERNRKTPVNYFIKLRDTFKDSSRSVDYLMRLVDSTTGERIGRTYVIIFQMILLETLNTFGYLVDVLGDRAKPEDLKFLPVELDLLVYRFKGFFTLGEIEAAIKEFLKLNKMAWSVKYQAYYVVDFMKHCGNEVDWKKYQSKD
ncbi:MAG: hypothetical protein AB7E23_05755 [Bacilli bacterium]